MKLTRAFVPLIIVGLVIGACTVADTARRDDQKRSGEILVDMQNAHPVPKFPRSQLRQNLVEIVTAQAETTQTTTFFFNLGVVDPVNSCPSIGFPIPATMQLTNPLQIATGGVAVPQVEPTGIFSGETTGTYVMCIDAQGRAYVIYWEGFVQTLTGPAEWKDGRIQLVGPPSFEFSTGNG